MTFIDWIIVVVFITGLILSCYYTKRYMRSVLDFLAANRCAGRYLMAVSEGTAAIGAITIIANFEMYYKVGFSGNWWHMMYLPVSMVISLSGWVYYRFRQTRALTLAQFFEMRYSKKFRIFAGILAFVSGLINFGIFPVVGARFFVYFCGLPETIAIASVGVPTFMIIMGGLIIVSLFFAFGGQITVMVTDFLQGTFSNIVYMIIFVVLIKMFDWSNIVEGLKTAAPGQSMIDPFDTTKVKDFNIWYFVIYSFGMVYSTMAWQGAQGYNCCALSPHETKMARVLSTWRGAALGLILIFIPVCAFVVMHHPLYASIASSVASELGTIGNEAIRQQVLVSKVLSHILPRGLVGLFCAVMLASFISNLDTYMHSWGSIFIQDVILPLRKNPLTTQQHLKVLKYSMIGVAVFVFVFGLFFKETQYIFMYWAITGSIWLGGAGAVIIGGLYWKRGTTTAAWSALIVGSVLSFGGIVLEKSWPLLNEGNKFPINGQWVYLISMVSAIFTYIIVSLLCGKQSFNLDKLLHRGQYRIGQDVVQSDYKAGKISRRLGINSEFSKWDSFVYIATFSWSMLWITVFVVGTVCGLIFDVKLSVWILYWRVWLIIIMTLATVVTIWFGIGGVLDMKKMFSLLKLSTRDTKDDGGVIRDVTEKQGVGSLIINENETKN